MLIEEDDDEFDSEPCPICGEDDNEDDFLGCDGCSTEYHSYCVDLTSIPHGHWFCEQCTIERTSEGASANIPAPRPRNAADRRTRSQQRRVRNRTRASTSTWARLWQSVQVGTHIDLDFPFDEGSSPERTSREQRERSQRRDFRQWERRFQVAERQGAANRFREAASTLLDIRAPRERPNPPEPESQEEIRAWNALEKAKQIQMDPSPNKRKRKSATTSPSDVESVPKPERPLKRPRTRRNEELAGSSSDVPAESSNSRRNSVAGPSSSHIPGTVLSKGPSFLQSLLQEVEASAAPDETKGQTRPPFPSATGNSSPRVSSPGASPPASNHASPRALSTTPPPHNATRPLSPFSLTSKVEPIFPPPEFSPSRASPEPTTSHQTTHDSRHPTTDRRHSPNAARQPRSRTQQSPSSSPPRSAENSPSRINLSLSAKSELQSMVTAALKPHYKSNEITNDQYTAINRNISRMLYDKVGEDGKVNGEDRENWEQLASDEVTKAVQALKIAA